MRLPALLPPTCALTAAALLAAAADAVEPTVRSHGLYADFSRFF